MSVPPLSQLSPQSSVLSPRAVLRAWRRAAGPWAPYVWPTLLTVPRPTDLPDNGAPESLASAWVEEFLAVLSADRGPAGGAWRGGTALALADLPALVALASAPCLARRGIRPVAVLRRWPSPQGLLPYAPLVEAYYRFAGGLRLGSRGRGAVFLVESERLLPVPSALWEPPLPLRTHLDNRYALDSQDLPRAEHLRREGITTLLAAVSPDPATLAPDLKAYCSNLAADGFALAMLPLRALGRAATAFFIPAEEAGR